MAARVAEAHVDAVAILHELGGKPPESGQLWGVWAAESPDAALTATDVNGAFTLTGTKVWCSGAGFCTHALVTARLEDATRGLFAVQLTDPAVKPLPSTWWNAGMAGSDTRPVQFTNAHAVAVGDPGDYLNRPGFWHGAIGVAACWLGGARRVADPLYRCAASESADAYSLAHLGAVDAALAAGDAILAAAATQVDVRSVRPRRHRPTAGPSRAHRRGTRGRRSHHPHRPRAGTGPALPGRTARPAGRRPEHLHPAKPCRAGPGRTRAARRPPGLRASWKPRRSATAPGSLPSH